MTQHTPPRFSWARDLTCSTQVGVPCHGQDEGVGDGVFPPPHRSRILPPPRTRSIVIPRNPVIPRHTLGPSGFSESSLGVPERTTSSSSSYWSCYLTQTYRGSPDSFFAPSVLVFPVTGTLDLTHSDPRKTLYIPSTSLTNSWYLYPPV